MRKIFLIAGNNLTRKKSDVVILFFLMMLATILCYVSISVLVSTPKVIESVYEDTNAPDFFYCSSSSETEKISAVFKNRPEVETLETAEGVCVLGKYRKADEEAKEGQFLIEPMEAERTIGTIPKIGENQKYNSILLPYYLKDGEGIEEKDTVYLTLGEKEYAFIVDGFIEDALFSTPITINIFRMYITKECYEDILEAEAQLEDFRCQLYKMKLKEGTGIRNFDEDIMAALTKEVPDLANYMNLGLNRESMMIGASSLPNIGMGVLLAFSVLLITIALVIVYFSIRNFIDGNLKNIGILMSSGYTKKELICVSLLEMSAISAISACIGLIIGGVFGKALGGLEAAMTGFRWNQPFDMATALFVWIFINLLVLGVTFFAARIYGKLSILDALRGGIKTHNFQKNHIPLSQSRLPYVPALGIKSILREKGKSIAVIGIAALLSFASCIGLALYQNFSPGSDTLIKLMGVETGTAVVSGNHLEEIGKELESWDCIERVLYYDNRSVILSAGEEKMTVNCDFWMVPEQNVNAVVIEGRLPRYDNEIGITALIAKQLGVKVGDVIYVEGEQERKDYIVSCIDQKMMELGMRAGMTMEGAERINGNKIVNQLYLYAKDEYTFEYLEDKLKEKYDGLSISDSRKSMETMVSSMSTVLLLICSIFSLLTLVIVALIIILLVRTKVTKEWNQYGIYRALGFTTGQLIMQIQMSHLPLIFTGAVIGAVLSIYLLNPILSLCLSFSGIVQCGLHIHIPILIFVVAAMSVTAFVISFLCALRVKKLEVIKMLNSV